MSVIREAVFIQDRNNSVLDVYSNKVFRIVVLLVPLFFLCGNATMTFMYYNGMYPTVNGAAMWFSNAVDILYLLIAIYLVRTSYGPDGLLIPNKLAAAKMVLMIMVVVQWNLNSYICPFRDFWAYAPLFVVVEAFFFDVKLVSWSTLLILVSMFISWLTNGAALLPVRDEFYYLNLTFREICLAFTLLSINFITGFGKVFIIEMISTRDKEREIMEKSLAYEREARMKSDFLANMSHEIRTPMNAVIGMAELAMREEMTSAAKDCIVQIQKSGRNLLNIINDILDYSKIESGKMEIVPERYEPSVEINDIANVLATRVGEKDLNLYFVVDPCIPRVLLGDAMRIRQVIINLVNNAIKFTQNGSVGVILQCKNTDPDEVNITYHIRDTGIGIRKEDMDKLFVSFQQVDSRRNRTEEGTGLGLAISQSLVEAMGGVIGVESEYGRGSDFWFSIPQKVLDSAPGFAVTDPGSKRAVLISNDHFDISVFRDDMNSLGVGFAGINSTDEYKPLTGIRDYLFFAAEQYDDKIGEFLDRNPDIMGIVNIGYNSGFKPDRGNLYVLRCPVSTPGIVKLLNNETSGLRESEEEGAYSANFSAPTAKVLIVDDNEINIAITEGLLSEMDMIIDSATGGAEAVSKAEKEHYDIILMDHMMPEVDGVDATKMIRENIKENEPVIIALSANAVEEARKLFFEAGMNDFVAKPVDVKDLVSKIRKWLPEEKIEKK
ncbi:MAG: response regulator [Lachnospiraceae bacterium]|nr:response regulator [Lachnospiraceae bacterium]